MDSQLHDPFLLSTENPKNCKLQGSKSDFCTLSSNHRLPPYKASPQGAARRYSTQMIHPIKDSVSRTSSRNAWLSFLKKNKNSVKGTLRRGSLQKENCSLSPVVSSGPEQDTLHSERSSCNEVTHFLLPNQDISNNHNISEMLAKQVELSCQETTQSIFQVLDQFQKQMLETLKRYTTAVKSNECILSTQSCMDESSLKMLFPFEQIKEFINNVFSTASLSVFVLDLKAHAEQDARIWKDVYGPIGYSILEMLEQQVKTTFSCEKQSFYMKVSAVTRQINEMRNKILQTAYVGLESSRSLPLPLSFPTKYFPCRKECSEELQVATLDEAAEWVLDASRCAKKKSLTLLTTEEELECIQEKLQGRWGSITLLERWLQDSMRWEWLDIYGRNRYLEERKDSERIINLKKETFLQNLDKRLSELWLGSIQALRLNEFTLRSNSAQQIVSHVLDRFHIGLIYDYDRVFMEIENYVTHLIRFFETNSSLDSSALNPSKSSSASSKGLFGLYGSKKSTHSVNADQEAMSKKEKKLMAQLENVKNVAKASEVKVQKERREEANAVELQKRLEEELQRVKHLSDSYRNSQMRRKELKKRSKMLTLKLKQARYDMEMLRCSSSKEWKSGKYHSWIRELEETMAILGDEVNKINREIMELNIFENQEHSNQDKGLATRKSYKSFDSLGPTHSFNASHYNRTNKNMAFLKKLSRTFHPRTKKAVHENGIFVKTQTSTGIKLNDEGKRAGENCEAGNSDIFDQSQWDDLTLDLNEEEPVLYNSHSEHAGHSYDSPSIKLDLESSCEDENSNSKSSRQKGHEKDINLNDSKKVNSPGPRYLGTETFKPENITGIPSEKISRKNQLKYQFDTMTQMLDSHSEGGMKLSETNLPSSSSNNTSSGDSRVLRIRISPPYEDNNALHVQQDSPDEEPYVLWNTRYIAQQLKNHSHKNEEHLFFLILFSTIGTMEHLGSISRALSKTKFSAKETIYIPGDEVSVLYIIRHGRAAVLSTKNQILERLTSGAALLDLQFREQTASSVSIIAETQVVAVYLMYETFVSLQKELQQKTFSRILCYCQELSSPFAECSRDIQQKLAASMTVSYCFYKSTVTFSDTEASDINLYVVLRGTCIISECQDNNDRKLKTRSVTCSAGQFFSLALLSRSLQIKLLATVSSSEGMSLGVLSLHRAKEILPESFDLDSVLAGLGTMQNFLSKSSESKEKSQGNPLGKLNSLKKRDRSISVFKIPRNLSRLLVKKS